MAEKIYVKGFMTFARNEKAPDFVLGTLVVSLIDLVTFCKENPELLTDYKGTKQLRCNILQGKDKINFTVDTFKPEKKADPALAEDEPDGLPF